MGAETPWALAPFVGGLIAALCWGISDYLARDVARAMGPFRAQLWSQLVGCLLVAVPCAVQLVTDERLLSQVRSASSSSWGFMLLYSLMTALAVLAFFEAFGVGKLVVVAPVIGAYGAVTVAWNIAWGLRPTTMGWVGFACVVFGAVMASIPPPGEGTDGDRRGALFAGVAAVLFGTAFFVLGRFVVPPLGALLPAATARLIGPLLLAVVGVGLRVRMQVPPTGSWGLVALTGGLAAIATVSTGWGSIGGKSAIVSVLGSLSVVVTVLIGLVRLRERVAPHQWVGAALAMVGIPLLSH